MITTFGACAIFALHALLGIGIVQASALAFLHAALTLCLAVRVAARGPNERAAIAVAYVSGSEVLWRMTTDRLPWEIGKYLVLLVCLVSIWRTRGLRGYFVPLLFFSLLLPSAVLTVTDMPFEEARQQISFNLSGPLSLAMCAAFFSLVTLSEAELERVLFAFVAPVISIASIVLFKIVTAPEITFNTESNFQTSGGFGPNQVSATLGLATLMVFFWIVACKMPWSKKLLLCGVMGWLATQCALTFSRGGLFAASGAAAVASLCLARDRRARLRVLAIALLAIGLGRYVVWPRLDAFTGGTISQRFTEADVTRRGDLGAEDLVMWSEHPILGVGPGRSLLEHDDGIIAHTEFTRLLAEHGSLGATAIVLFIYMGWRALRQARPGSGQGLTLGMMAWATLFMLNSAMRTAAPSFLYGFAFAAIATAPAAARAVKPQLMRVMPLPPRYVIGRSRFGGDYAHGADART